MFVSERPPLPPDALVGNLFLVQRMVLPRRNLQGPLYVGCHRDGSHPCLLQEIYLPNLSESELYARTERLAGAISTFKKLPDCKTLARVVEWYESNDSYYGWLLDDDRVYVQLEYVRGIRLADFVLKYGKWGMPQAVEWSIAVAQALAFLDQQPRRAAIDVIDPADLLLTDRGDLKIVDYRFHRFYLPNCVPLFPRRDVDFSVAYETFGALVEFFMLGVDADTLTPADKSAMTSLRRVAQQCRERVGTVVEVGQWRGVQSDLEVLRRLVGSGAAAVPPPLAPVPVAVEPVDGAHEDSGESQAGGAPAVESATDFAARARKSVAELQAVAPRGFGDRSPARWRRVGFILAAVLIAAVGAFYVVKRSPAVARSPLVPGAAVYVNSDGHRIVAVDPQTHAVVRTFDDTQVGPLQAGPGHSLVVFSQQRNDARIFSTVAEPRTLTLGGPVNHSVVSPDGRHLYCIYNARAGIADFNLEFGRLERTIPTRDVPVDLTFSADATRLVVLFKQLPALDQISLDSRTVVGHLALTGEPGAVAMSGDGQTAWIAYPTENAVAAIGMSSDDHPVRKVSLDKGRNPLKLRLSSDGTEVLVLCADSATVAVIDASTGTLTAELETGGSGPVDWCMTSGGGEELWVANYQSSTVGVINMAENQLATQIQIEHPRAMQFVGQMGARP